MSRLVHPTSPKLREQAVRGHQEGVRPEYMHKSLFSLCSPGWPVSCVPPASASQGLGVRSPRDSPSPPPPVEARKGTSSVPQSTVEAGGSGTHGDRQNRALPGSHPGPAARVRAPVRQLAAGCPSPPLSTQGELEGRDEMRREALRPGFWKTQGRDMIMIKPFPPRDSCPG